MADVIRSLVRQNEEGHSIMPQPVELYVEIQITDHNENFYYVDWKVSCMLKVLHLFVAVDLVEVNDWTVLNFVGEVSYKHIKQAQHCTEDNNCIRHNDVIKNIQLIQKN